MNRNNINKLPIIKVRFKTEGLKTTCTIVYWNPLSQKYCTVKGVAKCSDDNEYSLNKGLHIAESRAKMIMYKTYMKALYMNANLIISKYRKLVKHEKEHIFDLIYDKNM